MITEVADYCETDVVNTYRVWLRYELFRGRLSGCSFSPQGKATLHEISRITRTPMKSAKLCSGFDSVAVCEGARTCLDRTAS